MGTSSANSAAIHAGYDALPGTNKALTNMTGVDMWPQLSQELGINYERCGDYVVAVNDEDMQVLEELMERGKRNGVPGMEIISGEKMRQQGTTCESGHRWGYYGHQPAALGDPFGATVAAAENAVMNGVVLKLNTAFEDFILEESKITGIRTNKGDFACRWVVNAAGLHADEVMHKAGIRPEFHIRPRRGEYIILDKADFQLTNTSLLFPTPSEKGKGILVASTLHGNVIVGPNANFVDSKENKDVTKEGIQEIWEGGSKLVPCHQPQAHHRRICRIARHW